MVMMQPRRVPERGIIRLLETPSLTLVYEERQIRRPGRRCEFLERVEDVDAVFLLESGLSDPGSGQGGEEAPVVVDGPSRVEVGEGCYGRGDCDG